MQVDVTQSLPLVTTKFILFSIIGIILFFVQIEIGGVKTIPIDHMLSFVINNFDPVIPFMILALVSIGVVHPFYSKTWNSSKISIFFTALKIIGLVITLLIILEVGPEWFITKGTFYYNVFMVNVGLVIPLGAIVLMFLVGYGFIDFVGVIIQPIMRPVFKTPGRSALDAVASFVGSNSLGLFVTDRVYQEGGYTHKEACIIAAGFSTVSAPFMLVLAKALGFGGDKWLTFFLSALFITFAVTALITLVYPLKGKSDDYFETATPNPEEEISGSRLLTGFKQGIEACDQARPIWVQAKDNVLGGLLMSGAVLGTGIVFILAGLWLLEFTFIFDALSYIFYPILWILQVPEIAITAKSAVISIVEVFVTITPAFGADDFTRFVSGMLSISVVICFASPIPLISGTKIPLSLKDMLVIWLWRVLFTLVLASIIGHILF